MANLLENRGEQNCNELCSGCTLAPLMGPEKKEEEIQCWNRVSHEKSRDKETCGKLCRGGLLGCAVWQREPWEHLCTPGKRPIYPVASRCPVHNLLLLAQVYTLVTNRTTKRNLGVPYNLPDQPPPVPPTEICMPLLYLGTESSANHTGYQLICLLSSSDTTLHLKIIRNVISTNITIHPQIITDPHNN